MSPNSQINNGLLIDQESVFSDKEITIKPEEKDGKRISLLNHKYLNQIILLYVIFFFFTMSSFLYNIFIPNMFLDYVNFKFPNYSQEEVQSAASYYKAYSDALPNLSMFLLGPMIGVLSDKYGRKPVLYLSVVATLIDILSCYVSSVTHNLYYYYVFHTIGGVNNVISAAVFSYVADISSEDQVPVLFSLAGVSLGVGVVAGPLIFVYTSSSNIQNLTLYVTAGTVFCCILGIPFLSESLDIAKNNNRITSTISTLNPFKLVKSLFTTSGYIFWVVLIFASINYTGQDMINDYYYYCSLVYNWGEKENGYFLAGLGCTIILWGAIVIPILLKYFSERKVISLGYCFSLLAHTLFVLSKYNYIIWIFGASFGAFVPNNMNLIQSVVSRATPPELQGSVLTGVQCVGALFTFLGSIASDDIFSYFTSSGPIYFPQAIFAINGCVVFITLIGTLLVWRYYKNPNPLVKEGFVDENTRLIN